MIGSLNGMYLDEILYTFIARLGIDNMLPTFHFQAIHIEINLAHSLVFGVVSRLYLKTNAKGQDHRPTFTITGIRL